MIRIPLLLGHRLTLGGIPNRDAVRVTVDGAPARVHRIASSTGWMLLLVNHDEASRVASVDVQLGARDVAPRATLSAISPHRIVLLVRYSRRQGRKAS